MATPVRLQKLLAAAGIASRRAAERLIAEGHVSVNGAIVREPGSAAVPGRDDIRVDGASLRPPTAHTYILLHKPRGYVTSVRDPHAERTVMQLLPRRIPRTYPVGRLDRESEGVLLLTDDGEMTERLLHPRYGIEREYAVLVRGDLSHGVVVQLREGIKVEGILVKPISVVVTLPPAPIVDPGLPGTRWLRITVGEGRKREVRAICAAVHLHVMRLIRVRFGPLLLDDLAPGATRRLTEEELATLNTLTGRAPVKPRIRGAASRPLNTSVARQEPGRGERSAVLPEPATPTRRVVSGPRRSAARPTRRRPPRKRG